LAVGNARGTITIHDVEQGRRIRSFQSTGVQALAFRPDGTALAVAGIDGRVRLLHETGKQISQFDVWPDGIIRSVLFNPQGSHLVTVNGNDTAYVYRLAAQGEGKKP
jgi:WD40 repeat protein